VGLFRSMLRPRTCEPTRFTTRRQSPRDF
jgi:hypothetical protein